MNYLTYNLGCGLVEFRDISHRTWNTCCGAMRDAGVWNFFLLAGAAMSVDGGPWSDQRWFQSGREAVEEYLRVADPDCPIFNEFMGLIAIEIGKEEALDDLECAMELFSSLRAGWPAKSPKVASSRWFQVVGKFQNHLLPIWHRRLVVLVYMCLSCGFPVKAQSSYNTGSASDTRKSTRNDEEAKKLN